MSCFAAIKFSNVNVYFYLILWKIISFIEHTFLKIIILFNDFTRMIELIEYLRFYSFVLVVSEDKFRC